MIAVKKCGYCIPTPGEVGKGICWPGQILLFSASSAVTTRCHKLCEVLTGALKTCTLPFSSPATIILPTTFRHSTLEEATSCTGCAQFYRKGAQSEWTQHMVPL